MKKLVVFSVAVCLAFAACGMPAFQGIRPFPADAGRIFSTVLVILQEGQWQIDNADKDSGIILAKKFNWQDNLAKSQGKEGTPLVASIVIKPGASGASDVSININQPGVIMKTKEPREETDKLFAALADRLK